MSHRCVDIVRLERFATGDLSDAEKISIDAHLSSCGSCHSALSDVVENLALESPLRAVLAAAPTAAALESRDLPKQVGAYRILRELGRGGMGVVYEAEQTSPRRRVAIKTLLPSAGAKAPHALAHEAESLARLRHSGIATIYEVGETPDGVAFLSMELVDGVSLRRFLASRKSTTAQRIKLCLDVCRAVAHAHQRGIIHRDLKPSNVMVTPQGDVKVLDFGLSRAVHGRDSGSSHRTLSTTGHIAGTVPYMSPEQVRGHPGATDVRSDVYSLGVLTYEALTGHQPYDLSHASLPEAARIVCEREPILPVIDGQRADRDITAILLKCLEKDPDRRYASASELADDLERYLSAVPVLARPATLGYQFRKLLSRHRVPAASAAVLLVVVLAAGIYSSVLAVSLSRERAEVTRQARIAELVNAFLVDTLTAADPEVSTTARETTIRDAVERAAIRLHEGSLRESPEVEATVRAVVGNVFRSLGQFDQAIDHLTKSVALHESMTPEGSEAMAYSLHKLGRTLDEQGDLAQAEQVTRRALRMRRMLLGTAHPDYSKTLNNLGWLVARLGRLTEANTILEEALSLRRSLYGPSHSEVATTLNNLGALRMKQDRPDDAATLFQESLDMDRACRGETHTNIVSTMSNLAVALARQGKLEEAGTLQEDAVKLRMRISGESHPLVAVALNNLGQLRYQQHRFSDAAHCYERAAAVERLARGERTDLMGVILSNQAEVHRELGEMTRAIELHEHALGIRREVLPPHHSATLQSCLRWVELVSETRDAACARQTVEDCMSQADKHVPDHHRFWQDSRSLLARLGAEDGPKQAITSAP